MAPGDTAAVTVSLSQWRTAPYDLEEVITVTAEYLGCGDDPRGVRIDGESVGAVDYDTFTNIQDDHSYEVTFDSGLAPSDWAID